MAQAPARTTLALLGVVALATPPAGATDPRNGAAAFVRQCALCHTVDRNGPNRFGPNLFGMIGRRAGTVPGFRYSEAFTRTADWEWSAEALAAWISAPQAMVPGTSMGVFQGVADRDRDDIVAFLSTRK